ncbi:MCP four helix bundle domain-containing protein [Neolewinella lacunae]|uniref:MCP four helix bundle domain-containing protein n=1 Tax=Neolewinella lacunae TaxID=1517758 RepID=A0A923PH81_9BACT|nr:MCP four helix bundle domain-containing protein [Neolewinella lacunae]MBC6994020.1 MCP four helix bundle domain-containing protein [Neolewinella lacunae]MDN3634690.1 MCP four helix bundle domain-containing protein [Neolewinella lacunae]
MNVFNKVKWVLGISLVFILILTTNLIDRQSFTIVRDAVQTIYADRLVAQNLIYGISVQIGQKELAYVTLPSNEIVATVSANNEQIAANIEQFATTKLTPQEEVVFKRLRQGLQELEGLESAVGSGTLLNDALTEKVASIRTHLDDLSVIQMQQSRLEVAESNRAIGSADLFTQLEIAALIVMAIAVQVIIIYTPRKEPAE